jgi:hypothetical protein
MITHLNLFSLCTLQVMKARKLADAQELVSRANGDKKVQKLIGKKPPAAKKGRPPAAAKATAKAAAKATAKATAKSKGKGKKVDHQEVEPCEDPSGEGGDDAADGGVVGDDVVGDDVVGDDSVESTNAKPAASDLAAKWALMDSWHFVLNVLCFFDV